MISFFKGAVRELKHVVWPTRKETQKYFLSVLVILILFGVYLFVANTAFSELLFFLKG
ncbi:preprotein translocase subunit SecE [Candidatus Gracilibacteria bacterium]|nr:preprotein translocase subunit SecE [Candidatus Gracilibacteria bacterium]